MSDQVSFFDSLKWRSSKAGEGSLGTENGDGRIPLLPAKAAHTGLICGGTRSWE